MSQCGFEVRHGGTISLDRAGEPIEAFESVHLLGISQTRSSQGAPQNSKRFIVSLKRNWKWMTVLPAMRKREAGGIRKTARCAVYHFCDERERLQSSWTQSFHQQQGSEVTKILLVRDCKHRAQSLQINVFGPNLVTGWHGEFACVVQRTR
jgi:hypothetical protein